MEIILLMSLVISFLVTLLLMPAWIKKCRQIGLLWRDMNKYKHPENVASSGGLIVITGFVLGVLYFVAFRTFLLNATNGINIQIFAVLSVVLIFAILGFVDDILGWSHGGLPKRVRLLLAFVASIPLVVINAGTPFINVPFFGELNLGFFYLLVMIPLAIVGVSTTYNFLAGFNGLEAGQGILILSFLSYVAYVTGSAWLAVIGLCMVASLAAFYLYNRVPAKVFPGDILTYSTGAMIAIMCILGNFEKVAVFIFIPYIIEVILKLRGGLKKYSFAKPNKDGSLSMPYDKIYGLTHLSLFLLKKVKKKVYERDVVYFIFGIQLIFIIIGFFLI
ncbi:glycosyl transferase family 4 [Candidatus Pacearchaeota archaeon]|nr:glycosyl transferase family 4 [Candidatus Pacearchaeota archaeon]